ncbi:MAG TPA: glucose 1-dehydrogenase [Acidimicrobiales bacterium]|nr:glucose 1-dehydrogenase [Acidimicrobiales bacterium]
MQPRMLQGQVAVVTGAGRGIGAAIADALAAAGADVAVWDLDPRSARDAADALARAHAVRAMGLEVDVSDTGAVDAATQAVEEGLSVIDILVNNAGVDAIGPFLDSDESSWDRIIAVNLKGTIACCHRILRGMVDRGRGRVVNIGSDAGKVGSSGEAVYSATKGGVIALTKTLAREVASTGITVNCVCPGPTQTVLLDQLATASPKVHDALARAIPLRRIAQPSEIAPAVVFLASDAGGYITGQAISVSGGLTMS